MTIGKKGSGEHPAIQQLRKKADSFDETTMPMLERLRETVEKGTSAPPTTSARGSGSLGAVVVLTVHGGGELVKRLPADAARLASQLVEELRVIGHTVTFATIAHGGETVVIDQGKGSS